MELDSRPSEHREAANRERKVNHTVPDLITPGRKQRAQWRAFTLIEVMVATVVLSVSLLAIFGTFSTAQRAAVRARNLDTAVELAEVHLASLMEQNFSPWGARQGVFNSHFQWKCMIKPDFEKSLLVVSIEVIWKERGATQSYMHRTVVVAPSGQRE